MADQATATTRNNGKIHRQPNDGIGAFSLRLKRAAVALDAFSSSTRNYPLHTIHVHLYMTSLIQKP